VTERVYVAPCDFEIKDYDFLGDECGGPYEVKLKHRTVHIDCTDVHDWQTFKYLTNGRNR
jgi:hypothetical protein